MLITHGSAKRRMIGFAVEVRRAAARARIPERIAGALAPQRAPSVSTAIRGRAARASRSRTDARAVRRRGRSPEPTA